MHGWESAQFSCVSPLFTVIVWDVLWRRVPMKRILWLALLGACAGGAAQVRNEAKGPQVEGRAFRMRVQAEGLPWSRTSKSEPQILEVSAEALRIVSESGGDGVILRFDRQRTYTLDGAAKKFKEEPMSALADMSAKRAADREKKRKKRKKGSISVTVKKEIATALTMRKGQPVYSYVAKEIDTNRSVILIYTDGKERDGASDEVDEWKRDGGGAYAERKAASE